MNVASTPVIIPFLILNISSTDQVCGSRKIERFSLPSVSL